MPGRFVFALSSRASEAPFFATRDLLFLLLLICAVILRGCDFFDFAQRSMLKRIELRDRIRVSWNKITLSERSEESLFAFGGGLTRLCFSCRWNKPAPVRGGIMEPSACRAGFSWRERYRSSNATARSDWANRGERFLVAVSRGLRPRTALARMTVPVKSDSREMGTGSDREAILSELQVRVALDQLLGAVVAEADGQLSIFALAFDLDDGAHSIFRVADARADQRIACGLRRYGCCD